MSVNLKEEYGEPFIHTAYLRDLFPFAFWIGWSKKELRIWLATLFLSLTLGLGSYLWWNGEWFYLFGKQMFSLPFEWLRSLLPQIAITHPLRLSIGGQIICIALGLAGWKELKKKINLAPKILFTAVGLLICLEGLFGLPLFPLHSSDASILALTS